MLKYLIAIGLLLASEANAATLISTATGNIGSSSTWSTVDTTSLLNSETGNTALNATNGTSSAFTPGAITISGIAVKLAALTNSSGTVKIELVQAGSSVSGTPITVNCADLVSSADLGRRYSLQRQDHNGIELQSFVLDRRYRQQLV